MASAYSGRERRNEVSYEQNVEEAPTESVVHWIWREPLKIYINTKTLIERIRTKGQK